jgi:hypothetical protein
MFSSKGMVVIIILLITITAESAFCNGINPPRPKGSFIVTAVCKERKSNRQHQFLRTRIKYGDKTAKEYMKFQIGDATEQIAASDIESITLNATSIDPDGFIKATLVRTNDSEKTTVMLQVKTSGNNVKLEGFNKDGKKESINLSDCKSIRFTSSNTSNADDSNKDTHRAIMKQ